VVFEAGLELPCFPCAFSRPLLATLIQGVGLRTVVRRGLSAVNSE
jgi:hypothetical protein